MTTDHDHAPQCVGEDVARHDMVAGLIDQETFLGGQVVFGARALATVEAMFVAHLLEAWSRGHSSLLPVGVTHV